MNPSVHPDVREALTREVEHRSIKTGKKISLATLKAKKFYDRAPTDACDENWVHIAEHRDAWREFVVKPAKFHYNYRDPDEQVEYKIRPATPEKPSAERQRANDWDEWLLTKQPLNDVARSSTTSPPHFPAYMEARQMRDCIGSRDGCRRRGAPNGTNLKFLSLWFG
jgi:hypothetical protein